MLDNIKLIIFDLDGTLIDAYQAIIESVHYVLSGLGYKLPSDLNIRKKVGWGDKYLLARFVKRTDLERALAAYRAHHAKALKRYAYLYPGVSGLLKHLKYKKYMLAVASNRPTRFSLIILKNLKIRKYFKYVLCADKVGKGKPHPDILNNIMVLSGVQADETLFVGDMTIDAQAGKRAHVKTVIVTTGSSLKRDILEVKPYCIIKSIKELEAIV